jgi:pimeloyl-ACP methyl ester carboxylesterase
MSTITTKDGTQIDYNGRGTRQPVVFSHRWALSADAFEDQMFFLAASKIVKNATLKVIKGAPHGMCTTHKNVVNEDLLACLKA